VRHSNHLSRIRTGVSYDLLIHDVDLVLRMAGRTPDSLSAHLGFVHPDSRLGAEDIAEATLRFNGGMLATLSANRISQRKVRTLVINELERMVEVDLVRQDVTVYRHIRGEWLEGQEGAGVRQQAVIDIPVVQNMREPLAEQLDHFIGLASGQVDAATEIATLHAPHAVIAQVIEYADREMIGASGDAQYEKRRSNREGAAPRTSPAAPLMGAQG
jgi:predicted dehydrogenase